MNVFYLIFIELSATAYGRYIIHIYLYLLPCCYSNYFIL